MTNRHGVVHPSARFMERSWLGDVTPSPDSSGLKKWQTKACKVMFAIKIMIKKELLEYKETKTQEKKQWDMFTTRCTKKNELKLQLRENDLFSITERELTINEYYKKVKSLSREIFELHSTSKISKCRMRIIIMPELRPKLRGFIASIQGWPWQLYLG